MARKFPGIDPAGDGKYRGRRRLRHPKTGKWSEVDRIFKASSAEEASRLLARAVDDWRAKHSSVEERAARRRLGEALDSWLAKKRVAVKASTATTYETAVKFWRGSALDEYFLDKLAPSDVREVLDGAGEAGVSTETLSGKLRVLRTFAAEEACLRIVEGIRLKRTVQDEERMEDEGRGLDVDELRRLLDRGPKAWTNKNGEVNDAWRRAWALVLTLLWTGMRFSEVAALEWRDVDLDASTVRVRRRVVRGVVDHVKAKASKRTIVIPGELVEELREHRAAMLRRQQTGVASGLVFPSRRSTGRGYVNNVHARKAILRACEKANIGKRAEDGKTWTLDGRPVVHMLRHTFNNLLRQSSPELVRQALIGHADEEIGKRYSKVSIAEKATAVDNVVRMVRGAPGVDVGISVGI